MEKRRKRERTSSAGSFLQNELGTGNCAGLVVICTVGIIAVAADDLTGVGVANDFLFGPLGAGVGEGLIMIFG